MLGSPARVRVLLSPAPAPHASWPDLDLVASSGLGGVNTSVPNAAAAPRRGRAAEARGFRFRPERRVGDSGWTPREDRPPLWVEAKNVTMVEDGGPCSGRPHRAGRKHLLE
jgi:hypothetical protein